jgi:hypothetical protein
MKKLSVLFLSLFVLIFSASCDGSKNDISSSAVCGDSLVTHMEKCDGENLAGHTCETLGFGAGTLACALNCIEFDTTGCGASLTCGDGVKNGTDICDGEDLGGETCISRGFEDGTLKCLPNCAGFDTSQCGKSATCGNDNIDSGEVCDGTALNGRTCVHEGFEEGDLKCSEDCRSFDTSDCYTPCTPDCGDRVCGLDPVCGESCGECTGDWEMCNESGQCEKTCEFEPLEKDELLNINLETVNLSGTITLNGSIMPNNTQQYYEDYNRGRIVFTNKGSGDSYYVSIGNSGAASYNAKVFKGHYDVFFHPQSEDYQNVLPNVNIKLEENVDMTGAVVMKNYNLETVNLSGTVTLNGSIMPNNTQQYYEDYNRGRIVFVNKESGASYGVSIGNSGAASYNAKVFKGHYDVFFHPQSEDYQNVLPGIKINLDNNIEMIGTVMKNYNLETALLSGTVTLNGGTMPNNTKQYYEDYNRGRMIFRNKGSSDAIYVSIGNSGAGNYSVRLFKGSYDVGFTSQNEDYQNVLPGQRINIYRGCFDYSAGCDQDIEDITGTWEFIPEGAYWTPVTFNLVQDGEKITGTFKAYNSSGSIKPGTRKGNYMRFEFKPYYDMIVDGNIVSGCNIIGRFDTIGYSGSNYDSDFVGYKAP